MANKQGRDTRVAVIGLGRFGSSLALELVSRGWEVLGIDSDSRLVQKLADDLTHAVVADSTDQEALRQLGVQEFRRAVVGIGGDLEASILTASLLVDLGIPNIWAKAVSRQHGKILERVGVHHVVSPEFDMGERVAHLVTGRMLDYIEFEEQFALIKTRAPAEAVDRPLKDSQLRVRYGVTVVGVKRPGEDFVHATPETVIHEGDVLIVAGNTASAERFAELT